MGSPPQLSGVDEIFDLIGVLNDFESDQQFQIKNGVYPINSRDNGIAQKDNIRDGSTDIQFDDRGLLPLWD